MILTGKEVSAKIVDDIKNMEFKRTPCLAIVRVGANPSDLAYERGLLKKADASGIDVSVHELPEDVDTKGVVDVVNSLNEDENISGILVFRPLPKGIDDDAVRNAIDPSKDVDGATDISMAGVYSGSGIGFPPCTAEAAIEILKYYDIPIEGKRAVVIGRSLVIGKPVSLMLLAENATVTICHSRTPKEELEMATNDADILISCIGKAKAVGKDMINEDVTVIDVGINFVDGKMCGDVDYENVTAKDITPVPGGVGAVTSAVLMKHVALAANR